METQELVEKIKEYPIAVGGVLATIILAALVYFRGSVLPEVQADYDALAKDSQVISKNDVNAVNLEAHLNQLNEMVEGIESRLIDSEAVTDNFQYFLTLEEASEIDVDDPLVAGYNDVGNKKSPIDTKVFAQIRYRLNATGPFSNILDFMYRLRTGHHFYVIKEVALGVGDSQSAQNVNATILVKGLASSKKAKSKKK